MTTTRENAENEWEALLGPAPERTQTWDEMRAEEVAEAEAEARADDDGSDRFGGSRFATW